MVQSLKFFLGLCVCLLMVSCSESEKERLSRLVQEWEGKEILFPAHSTFTIQGKDTVDFDFDDAEYKIVTYIDSVGCTSCKLQLHNWKKLIERVEKLCDKRVAFVFYFCINAKRDLRSLTKADDFKYPVCFDETDAFNKLNKLPTHVSFQTFLLNNENEVQAIGNPVHNKDVKKLYLKIISGKEFLEEEQLVTTMVDFDKVVMDLGRVLIGTETKVNFNLINKGRNLLVIDEVKTSCGCTQVKYSHKPVEPNDSSKIEVTFKAEEVGRFNKVMTVYCNDKQSPFRLRIKGVVK